MRLPTHTPGQIWHSRKLPALVADLVDADAREVRERVTGRPAVSDDPCDDRSDAAPGDPHELCDRLLWRVRDEPGHLVVEVLGVPGAVAGPGDLGDRHPVGRAVDPRRVRLEVAAHDAQVERAPPPAPFSLVISRGTDPAAPAPALGRPPRTDAHDDRILLLCDLDPLDHGRLVDTDDPAPYARTEHAVLLPALRDR